MEKIEDNGLRILVDGSNVAFFQPTFKQSARFESILLFIKYLKQLRKKYGIPFQILVDASLRHHIDNEQALEKLIKRGKIIQCPSKREADYFLLTYFKKYKDKVLIISNDDFRDHRISKVRQSKFAIVLNEIIITPPIEDFIQKSGGF